MHSDDSKEARVSPQTYKRNKLQLNTNQFGGSVQQLTIKSTTNKATPISNSAINTPKYLKFKSQSKGTQAVQSRILFDQTSQSKGVKAVNESNSTEVPSYRQYHSQAYPTKPNSANQPKQSSD